jgi:hypothetical protein
MAFRWVSGFFKEIRCGSVDSLLLVHDRVQWRALVNTAMNFQIAEMWVNLLICCVTIGFWRTALPCWISYTFTQQDKTYSTARWQFSVRAYPRVCNVTASDGKCLRFRSVRTGCHEVISNTADCVMRTADRMSRVTAAVQSSAVNRKLAFIYCSLTFNAGHCLVSLKVCIDYVRLKLKSVKDLNSR